MISLCQPGRNSEENGNVHLFCCINSNCFRGGGEGGRSPINNQMITMFFFHVLVKKKPKQL